MKVILLEKITNLGNLGDIVTVRNGYARNYLFPQKKAERADSRAIEQFEEKRAELIARQEQQQVELQNAKKVLDGYTLSLVVLATPDGNLYGSITAQIIAGALNDQKILTDFNVKRSQIKLPEGPLKELGDHKIGVKLNEEIEATITVSLLADTSHHNSEEKSDDNQ